MVMSLAETPSVAATTLLAIAAPAVSEKIGISRDSVPSDPGQRLQMNPDRGSQLHELLWALGASVTSVWRNDFAIAFTSTSKMLSRRLPDMRRLRFHKWLQAE
jgi:hypothetical protein